MTSSQTPDYPAPDAFSATYSDSVLAALNGLALGDALGFPLELLSLSEINHRFGTANSENFVQKILGENVEVSDDTQLSLYTLDGISEVLEWNNDGVAADEIACIWLALLRWYRGIGEPLAENAPFALDRPIDSFTEIKKKQGPGQATLKALASGEMQMMDKNINKNALGTGALVRSTVLGFLPVTDQATVIGLASRAASLTHGHPDAIISAVAQALLTRYCLTFRGEEHPVSRATQATLSWLYDLPVPSLPIPTAATLNALKSALEHRENPSLMAESDNGWLAPTVLARGVVHALHHEVTSHYSAIPALVDSAVWEGDSDSAAAITGALLGAAYGSEIFPDETVERIDVRAVIDHLHRNWNNQLGISA